MPVKNTSSETLISSELELQEQGKNKKAQKRKRIIGATTATTLLLGGALWLFYYNQNKQLNVVGFQGVGAVNDSIALHVQEEPTFKLEGSLAISSPVHNVGGIVENLESFKRQMEESLRQAEEANSGQISIPSIGILFELGTELLRPQGEELLKEFIRAYLQTNKQAVVLVEGYTCDLGTDKLNEKLSQQRTEVIKNILVNNGVPSDKVETQWFGESKYSHSMYKTREEHRRANISIK